MTEETTRSRIERVGTIPNEKATLQIAKITAEILDQINHSLYRVANVADSLATLLRSESVRALIARDDAIGDLLLPGDEDDMAETDETVESDFDYIPAVNDMVTPVDKPDARPDIVTEVGTTEGAVWVRLLGKKGKKWADQFRYAGSIPSISEDEE